MEFFANLPVAGINTVIADHFVMLFRDVLTVIMEGNKVTVIAVDPGRSNDRAAKAAAE